MLLPVAMNHTLVFLALINLAASEPGEVATTDFPLLRLHYYSRSLAISACLGTCRTCQQMYGRTHFRGHLCAKTCLSREKVWNPKNCADFEFIAPFLMLTTWFPFLMCRALEHILNIVLEDFSVAKIYFSQAYVFYPSDMMVSGRANIKPAFSRQKNAPSKSVRK